MSEPSNLPDKAKSPRRSLILAGGGLKVAYQAGVLQVWLDEAGLRFDHADGASGGVFNLVQYCQGSSGTQIADSWRNFPVLGSISLNWRQYFRLFGAESLLTYNGFRKVVLRERWKLDWKKIQSSKLVGTFNAYDFSKNRLVVRTQDRIDEDFLVACVSLPMWFPPVTIDNDRYIDAVYITDANLMEAISRGADELWIIWTVSRKAIWKGGFVSTYFQIIETSANGRLKADLNRIEANNDAIARNGRGEFGRPIKVQMLAAEVPLNYLINFKSTDFTAAVEQGIADARAWCRERGIALKPPAAPGLLELTFNETMQGGFALGATEPEEGREQGMADATTLTMHASIQIHDLDRFLNVPDHPGGLGGTIDFPPLGVGMAATTGVFNLLKPSSDQHVKLFVYELGFERDGKSYYLAGRKYVHAGGNALRETTTLYTRLHEGRDATGPVIGAGVLTLNVKDLILMLSTMRVHNARSKSDAFAALERFGKFFLGEMWDSYGIHLNRHT
ncbi:MAG: patatin-like phospholipase family protein [Xanthobacteraceae bacterium]|jgi:predicted acylesterase/phospholipase RssA